MKKSLYPAAYYAEKSTVSSANDTDIPIGKDENNDTYATFGVKTGYQASARVSYSFDTSVIPRDAVIQSVSLKIKASVTSKPIESNLYLYSPSYSSQVAKLRVESIFTSTDVTTINLSNNSSTSWTRDELDSLYMVIAIAYIYLASSGANLYFYGATLIVEYTSDSEDKLYFKSSGTWIECDGIYKKTNGVWTLQNEYAPLFAAGKRYNKKVLEPPQDIYTTLEYIESDGNQYVDTGFIPNQNSAMVVKFATTSQAGAIAACDETWGAKGFSVYGQSLAFANDTSGGAHNFYDGNNHIVEMNKNNDGKVYDNGNLKWTATRATFTVPCSLTLFCVNRNSDKQEFIPAKIFYCKLYDNGVVVKHLVPCLRKADGVNGFFDLYNNEFLPLQII